MPKFTCPHCETEFDFPEDQAGGVVTCLGCGRGVSLPSLATQRQPGAKRSVKKRGFWGAVFGWVGWLPIGAMLIVVGVIWAGAFPETGPGWVSPALTVLGVVLVAMWLAGYYAGLASDARRR